MLTNYGTYNLQGPTTMHDIWNCNIDKRNWVISLSALSKREQCFVYSDPVSFTTFEQALNRCSKSGFMLDEKKKSAKCFPVGFDIVKFRKKEPAMKWFIT